VVEQEGSLGSEGSGVSDSVEVTASIISLKAGSLKGGGSRRHAGIRASLSSRWAASSGVQQVLVVGAAGGAAAVAGVLGVKGVMALQQRRRGAALALMETPLPDGDDEEGELPAAGGGGGGGDGGVGMWAWGW
jgi:hypothetical protein